MQKTKFKMENIKIVLHVGFIFILTLVCSNCGKTPESGTTSGTFSDVYTKTIKGSSCVECHSPTGMAKLNYGVQLDFTSQSTSYSTLTNNNVVTASDMTGTCGSAKLIVSGSPSTSYFAAVLISQYNVSNFGGISGCTPYRTHLSDLNISAAEQTSITDWITNGAQNN